MAGGNARLAGIYFITTYRPRRCYFRHQRAPTGDIRPLFTHIYIASLWDYAKRTDGAPGPTCVIVGIFSIMRAIISSFSRLDVDGRDEFPFGGCGEEESAATITSINSKWRRA